MSWIAGGNVKSVKDIDTLEITGEVNQSQLQAVKEAVKVLVAALPEADELIIHFAGQDAADKPGQPHAPEAAISIHVATTTPLP